MTVRNYVCESAATRDDWRHDRRLVERFETHDEAYSRMVEHDRAGRRACCFDGRYVAPVLHCGWKS